MSARVALLLALLLPALPGAAAANAPPRDVPAPEAIVGVVHSGITEPVRATLDGVRQRLEQRGTRPAAEVLYSDSAAVLSLRERRPTVVIAVGGAASELARRTFPEAAVVTALVVDPPQVPGRATGVALEFSADQQLQWLRRVLPPTVERLGVVYSPARNEPVVARLTERAGAFGFRIVARPAAAPSEIPRALASLASGADVLLGVPDDVVMTPETAKSILLFSMRNRLPLVGLSAAWVRAGALLAPDRDYADIGAQCADLAMRLVDGEGAAVRVEAPRRLRYALNLRTAELMKLAFPADVVRAAAEVVR